MSRTYILDVDGCLADFILGFRTLANKMYETVDRPIQIYGSRDPRQAAWDLPDLTKDEQSKMWAVVKKDPLWWYHCPVLLTAEEIEGVRRMTEIHYVYFVTARVGINAKQQTETWLQRNLGVEHPTVIVCKWKGEISAAVEARAAIDDKLENANAIAWFTKGKTRSYLLDRAYNRANIGTSGKVIRVNSMAEFLQAES